MGYEGEPIGLVKIQKCLYGEKKNVCHKIINSKVKPKIQYLNKKPSDKCDFNLLSLRTSFVIKNIFVSINHLPQRWSYLQPTCIRCQIYIKRTWTWTTELTTDFESYDIKSGNLRAFHCVIVHCICKFLWCSYGNMWTLDNLYWFEKTGLSTKDWASLNPQFW